MSSSLCLSAIERPQGLPDQPAGSIMSGLESPTFSALCGRALLTRAVDKVREVERSAGFQPAVSPISNRQSIASPGPRENSGRPQAGSTAIQQVGNLRYDFVHRPALLTGARAIWVVLLLAGCCLTGVPARAALDHATIGGTK